MKNKCPYCNGKLTNGEARIHGTIGGFLLFGLSHENLYFKSETGNEIKILGSNSITPAMRCENCGIIILNKKFIAQNSRDIILDFLTICSSKELQENILESRPDCNIHEDIRASWNKIYCPQQNEFINSFTKDELKMLSEINDLIVAENWNNLESYSEKILRQFV